MAPFPAQGIKTLFQSLVMSLPAFGNVGALLGLFFFMYAYVGVMLFGKIRQVRTGSTACMLTSNC